MNTDTRHMFLKNDNVYELLMNLNTFSNVSFDKNKEFVALTGLVIRIVVGLIAYIGRRLFCKFYTHWWWWY